MTGIERIAAERKRQINEEGFDAEHDSQHSGADLLAAARCYADEYRVIHKDVDIPLHWPWGNFEWNPKTRERDLVRAGALALAAVDRIAAEIDRLQRETGKKESEVPE